MTEKSLHNPRVMAVFAHPDDEAWINGALALIVDKGYPLQVIYALPANKVVTAAVAV